MTGARYSVLGLGQVRSPWFGQVAAWATSGALPIDFVKCVSVGDVRQRITPVNLDARPQTALLVEAGHAAVDRAFLTSARDAGLAVLVVNESTAPSESRWLEIGADAVLALPLSPDSLVAALRAHGSPTRSTATTPTATIDSPDRPAVTGRLITVCGPGGTGASTMAAALAQGMADDVVETDHIVLADLARPAEQAMLHDAVDLVPGVEELVEGHRNNKPSADEVRSATFAIPVRGYRLLIGQRRPSAWSAMSCGSIEAGLAGLRRAFRTVVTDVTADFEGEREGGSLDVEERNALARRATRAADVVVVVGVPGMKGTHALARTVRDVLALGVAAERIVPVINRTPKPFLDARATRQSLAKLVGVEVITPVFVPSGPVDLAFRDGARLPRGITTPLTNAVLVRLSLIEREGPPELRESETPEPLQAGDLGLPALVEAKARL